jgi:hypothetical protein
MFDESALFEKYFSCGDAEAATNKEAYMHALQGALFSS